MRASIRYRYLSLVVVSVIGTVDRTDAFWFAIVLLAINIWLEKKNEELLDGYKEYVEIVESTKPL